MSSQLAPFNPENIPQALSLAEQLAKSTLIPTPLRGKPGDVLVVLMKGRELGLSPMQALSSIHVIEGKAVVSADMLVALCLSRPDVCVSFEVIETSDKRAVYETQRKGRQPKRLEWTLAQAQQAGLTSKHNWKAYPAAMLRARCAAALARIVYPELTAGIYTPDEADDIRQNTGRSAPPPGLSVPPPTLVDASAGATPALEATGATVDGTVAPQAEEADWTAGPAEAEPSELERVNVAILEAQSIGDLQALVKRINALPAEERATLRDAYNSRRAALATERAG
jgi:hypothetical protein